MSHLEEKMSEVADRLFAESQKLCRIFEESDKKISKRELCNDPTLQKYLIQQISWTPALAQEAHANLKDFKKNMAKHLRTSLRNATKEPPGKKLKFTEKIEKAIEMQDQATAFMYARHAIDHLPEYLGPWSKPV